MLRAWRSRRASWMALIIPGPHASVHGNIDPDAWSRAPCRVIDPAWVLDLPCGTRLWGRYCTGPAARGTRPPGPVTTIAGSVVGRGELPSGTSAAWKVGISSSSPALGVEGRLTSARGALLLPQGPSRSAAPRPSGFLGPSGLGYSLDSDLTLPALRPGGRLSRHRRRWRFGIQVRLAPGHRRARTRSGRDGRANRQWVERSVRA